MRRIRLYTIGVVVILLSAIVGVLWGQPAYAEYLYGRAVKAKATQVAAFVKCVDEGTDNVVILDAGFAQDGYGVWIAVNSPRPEPEPYPERGYPGGNKGITERRTARAYNRAGQGWETLLGCLLDEVPWAGYLRMSYLDLGVHTDQLHRQVAVSASFNFQMIFRTRQDMRELLAAYQTWYRGGNALAGRWIKEERILFVNYAIPRQLGMEVEIREFFPFPDSAQRIKRIASIEVLQDTAETPTGGEG